MVFFGSTSATANARAYMPLAASSAAVSAGIRDGRTTFGLRHERLQDGVGEATGRALLYAAPERPQPHRARLRLNGLSSAPWRRST